MFDCCLSGRKVALAVLLAFFTAASLMAQTVSVATSTNVIGRTPTYIGYGQGHYLPSNTSAWLQRSGANALRVWINAAHFAPATRPANYGDGVVDLATFEVRRNLLIGDPENQALIDWNHYGPKFQNHITTGRNIYNLAYVMGELRRINIHPIIVTSHCAVSGATSATNPRDWQNVSHNPSWMPISIYNNYADKWEFWKWHFITAYWLAREYGVTDHQIWNEPDHIEIGSNINQQDYLDWLRYGSDAKRAAIQAVNEKYGKQLVAKVYAPVITTPRSFHARLDNSDTRDDVVGWGEIVSRTLRTDFRGQTVAYNIFDVFDTHRYAQTPSVYSSDMDTLQNGMAANTPGGIVLPINISEHNVQNTSGFDESGDDLDMPRIFTALAMTYGKAAAKGVYGMQAFKYSNVNAKNVGYHFTGEGPTDWNTGGFRKGASVIKLFGKGFNNGRDLLQVAVTQSPGYGLVLASRNSENYYLWAVNESASSSFAMQLNVSGLGIAEGILITVEEVSATRNGEVAMRQAIPANKVLTLQQPPQSAWLITVPRGLRTTEILSPVADGYVQGGTNSGLSFGSASSLFVRDSPSADGDKIGYLKFNLSNVPRAQVSRAVLNVTGRNDTDTQPFSFHVYGILSNAWTENALSWDNSPSHEVATAKARGVGTNAFPIGMMTVLSTNKEVRLDVTDFVNGRLAQDRVMSFMFIREYRFAGDTNDHFRQASIASRETASSPTLELDYTSPTDPMPPVILVQPASRTVQTKDSVEFSVTSDGSLPLFYRWYLNETNLIADSNAASFVITNVQQSAAGVYSVMVSNNAGVAISSNATLTVLQQISAYEPFRYGVGNSVVGQGGWVLTSNSGDPTRVELGNLEWDGLTLAQGERLTWTNRSMSLRLPLIAEVTDRVFFSFLLRVEELGSSFTSDGVMAGFTAGSTTAFGTKLDLRKTSTTTFQLGTSITSSGVSWHPAQFQVGETLFVVGSYQFNPQTNDDIALLWINPSANFFGGDAPVPSVSATGGNDLSRIDRFFYRGNSTASPGKFVVDELRIARTWAEVTPPDRSLPELTVMRSGDKVILSWPSRYGAFHLEEAAQVGGSWTNGGNASAVGNHFVITNSIGNTNRFFRLQGSPNNEEGQ